MVTVSSTFGNFASTLADIVSKQKPALAAFSYNNIQSRNYYNNHIPMLFGNKKIVSTASTRVKIIKAVGKMKEESIESTNNNMLMDDNSNSKTDEIEVLVKSLEREGVTHLTYFELNKYARYFIDAVSRSEIIDLHGYCTETFVYYTAAGFAVADQGHRDRPGVCCISAGSGLIVNEVLVKCQRGPVVFIIVPFHDTERTYKLRFNDDTLPRYYRVLDVRDITTTVQQAFSSAYNKPGGPVFIDIQHLLLDHVDTEEELRTDARILVDCLGECLPRAMLYLSSSLNDGVERNEELSRFMKLTGIQVTHSLVGLEDACVVLYVGATCNDLPEIVAMNENGIVFLIDVGDEEEMQKIIKPRGRMTTFSTFKEINEILAGIRFNDKISCWGQLFLETQRRTEYVLARCYADIISTSTAANNYNDKRITREFAIRVLDEFFEDNKENVTVYRGDDDWLRFKCGAEIARPTRDIYVVIDGFEKGKVVNNDNRQCVIILDSSGWTKPFYQQTRKLFSGWTKRFIQATRELATGGTKRFYQVTRKLVIEDDNFFKARVVGQVVTNKCDLKNALYQYHEAPMRYKMCLVVAVVPPSDHFVGEEIPNFSRDLRFFRYPDAYLWDLVDRSSSTG